MDGTAPRAISRPLHAVSAPQSEFIVFAETLEYDTTHGLQFIDITDEVRGVVARSAVAFGQVAISSSHTTAAIVVNEHEPLLLNDLARMLSRLAPAGDYYEHNDFTIRTVNMHEDECANGHAHCQHVILGTSETLPIHDGELRIGPWQRVFLVELDHARHREVVEQALGVGGA